VTPRRYPGGRRRRPGRRPPYRFSGGPQGFTPPALRPVDHTFMRGLGGRKKRVFFNDVSGWIVKTIRLAGPVIDCDAFGRFDAIPGLCSGLAVRCWCVASEPFCRG
jgi:hypothetical protein